MLTLTDLVDGFRTLGVEAGDTLLVHSSYKSFGPVDGGPQTVIRALELAVDTEHDGTLVMPTFNFGFNKGEPWDVRTTPSKMGVLTELARQDPRAKRVFHPFYSFAVLGRHAEMLGGLRYKSAYERNSVFGKLRDLDGKIMVIGLSYTNSMTFFHHIEQMEGVERTSQGSPLLKPKLKVGMISVPSCSVSRAVSSARMTVCGPPSTGPKDLYELWTSRVSPASTPRARNPSTRSVRVSIIPPKVCLWERAWQTAAPFSPVVSSDAKPTTGA